MSKHKLLSSAVAALSALVLMFPTAAIAASAVPIATETTPEVVEPEDPEEPEDPTVTEEPEPIVTEEPVPVVTKQTPTQTKRTAATSKKTQTQATTEEPDDTDTQTQTKKTTKKTTKKQTETETDTTTTTESTTTGEDKSSYYSANIDVSYTVIDDERQISVKLKVDSDSKIAKAKIFLDFDKDILQYVSSEINDDNIGGISSDSCDDGRYRFEYSNSTGTEFDGTFVTVTFKIKQTSADQTSVMAVVDSLKDEEDNDIANRTISNAIISIPEKRSTKKTDDTDTSSVSDDGNHNYQPINLSLEGNENGVTLESLGIKNYKNIEIDDKNVAYLDAGKLMLASAGETNMTVTYSDNSKGYFNIKVAGGSSSVSDDSSSGSKIALTEDDGSSKQNTKKITAIIVIICVAVILLIGEYFIFISRKKHKKAERHSSHRHHDYDDEDDDSDMYHTPTRMPAQKIAEPEIDESDVNYSYPQVQEEVNDYADFLSGDDGNDIKFTGGPVMAEPGIKKDIQDFTLSQGGMNKN